MLTPRKEALTLVAVLSVVAATSCGEDEDGNATATLEQARMACEAVAACGGDQIDCLERFQITDLTSGCADAMETASCEAHQISPFRAAFANVCFPPCKGESSNCSDDGASVSVCGPLGGSLRLLTVTCKKNCARRGLVWTGVCGRTSALGDVVDEDVLLVRPLAAVAKPERRRRDARLESVWPASTRRRPTYGMWTVA